MPTVSATSPEEKADDARPLIDVLGLAPAAVFGTSSGATFALCLLVRHPEAVRRAILHEPVLRSSRLHGRAPQQQACRHLAALRSCVRSFGRKE